MFDLNEERDDGFFDRIGEDVEDGAYEVGNNAFNLEEDGAFKVVNNTINLEKNDVNINFENEDANEARVNNTINLEEDE